MLKNEKKTIYPNSITTMNLLLGFVSILLLFDGKYLTSAWLIIIAMFTDVLDGKVARWTNSFSEFGKEYDSFADALSFGAAPAALFFYIFKTIDFPSPHIKLAVMSTPLVFVSAGLIRLAKFNITNTASSEKSDFIGIPIPASAGTIVAYILFSYEVFGTLRYPIFIAVMILLNSYLMLSSIPYKLYIRYYHLDWMPKIMTNIMYLLSVAAIYKASYTFFPILFAYNLSGILHVIFHKKEAITDN